MLEQEIYLDGTTPPVAYGKMEMNEAARIVRVAFLRGVHSGNYSQGYRQDIPQGATGEWYIGEKNYLGKDLARPMLFDLLVWGFEEERLERLYNTSGP